MRYLVYALLSFYITTSFVSSTLACDPSCKEQNKQTFKSFVTQLIVEFDNNNQKVSNEWIGDKIRNRDQNELLEIRNSCLAKKQELETQISKLKENKIDPQHISGLLAAYEKVITFVNMKLSHGRIMKLRSNFASDLQKKFTESQSLPDNWISDKIRNMQEERLRQALADCVGKRETLRRQLYDLGEEGSSSTNISNLFDAYDAAITQIKAKLKSIMQQSGTRN